MKLVSGKRKSIPSCRVSMTYRLAVQEQLPLRPCKFDLYPYNLPTNPPSLFKPFHIPSVGTLQDGGLAHNNPVNIAGWECRRIWPEIERPDILVSLGTGAKVNPTPVPVSTVPREMMNGFVPRLWRSFMSSLDGQRVWQDVVNRLDRQTREDYFRLNVFLPYEEPRIDDISSMERLRTSVHTQSQLGQDCSEVAAALLVASFYFELIDVPRFSSGRYICQGSIRSRLPGGICITASERVLGLDWSFVTDTEILAYYNGVPDLCPGCRRYCKKVRFTVRHPFESFTLSVQCPDQRKRKISGFPGSISWFQSEQYLGWSFGTPYHDADEQHSCGACSTTPSESKRFSRDFAVAQPRKKRRRCI